MFSLGIGQPFPVFSLEAEDKPADVHLRMAFNNQREPTSELQVAVDIEPIGVLYAVAPPVPPAMLLLPATGVDHGEFLELMQQNPTEAWHMPAQISKIKCAPSRLTVHTLRVHSFELVYSKEFYNEGVHMIAFFLHAETTAKQPLLIEITIDGEEVIWASVRSPYAPIAAFFGEYVLKTLRHIGDAFKNTR
ncbi:hypothetical protein AGDE_14469 [Angomonas deanei]|nr:hypothetical protein AGDE_14469 [Angomonas deanei]|eukprot:EPY20826.1 hypothetical protein AGDE_14469 [Angomonas deanei]